MPGQRRVKHRRGFRASESRELRALFIRIAAAIAILAAMNRCFARLSFSVCAAAIVVPAATAQTTVVVPCALDNTLYEDPTGAFSNALGEGIFVGVTAQGRVRRALLRFGVAAHVPAGARVIAAQLDLHVTQSGALQATNVAGHRLLTSWGEGASYALAGGGGQGAPSTTGDATWMHRFWPATSWATAGGDFVATPSFVMSMPTLGASTSPSTNGCVADVQSWIDQPSLNFGWLLKAEVETLQASRARRLDSRQSPGLPPVLRVTYVLPGQSGTWGAGCATTNGVFAFAFVGPMAGGSTIALLHRNGPPSAIAVNIFALDFDAVGVPFLPGCALHLPLSQPWITGSLVVLDGTGSGAVPWTVPTQYPGLFFVSQTVAVDPSSPLGLVLSDVGLAVIQ